MFDLEATCWDEPRPRDRMETIEIGPVRLGADLRVTDELDSFVRPAVGRHGGPMIATNARG